MEFKGGSSSVQRFEEMETSEMGGMVSTHSKLVSLEVSLSLTRRSRGFDESSRMVHIRIDKVGIYIGVWMLGSS